MEKQIYKFVRTINCEIDKNEFLNIVEFNDSKNTINKTIIELSHSIFGVEIESFSTPEIKIPKNLFHFILFYILPSKLHNFIKFKVIQEQEKIVLYQYFPKLLPITENEVKIIVAMRQRDGKTIGHYSSNEINEYGITVIKNEKRENRTNVKTKNYFRGKDG